MPRVVEAQNVGTSVGIIVAVIFVGLGMGLSLYFKHERQGELRMDNRVLEAVQLAKRVLSACSLDPKTADIDQYDCDRAIERMEDELGSLDESIETVATFFQNNAAAISTIILVLGNLVRVVN